MMDLRGYTGILLDEGSARAAVLMRAYERLVRTALPQRSFEVDHVADTFHLVFPTPTQAVRTATAIAEALRRHNETHPDMQLPVSFGIDTGEGVRHGTRIAGSAPVVASHLCHRAQPGQVIVSETVFGLLRAAKTGPMRDLGVWQPSGRHPGTGSGNAMHIYEARAPDPRADGSNEVERFLTALLFTDIVGHTAKSAEMGDKRWRHVVEQHHAIVRDEIRRHGGMEIDTAGDGFYTTFETPSRAIECAFALRDRVHSLGIDVRAGVHVGECEIVAGKVGGIAVTIAARVRDQAGPGDVLVSQTVKDLVVGASYAFADRGRFVLKGVPGEWALYKIDVHPARDTPPT